jgi:zinc protease
MRMACFLIVLLVPLTSAAADDGPSYAVVVSQATLDAEGWRPVVEALEHKHPGAVRIVYDRDVTEALPALRAAHPRFTAFVARPEESERETVRAIHGLTRRLDEDAYTDTLWGVVTGHDARAALKVAAVTEPLTVRNVAAGTPVALDMAESGRWYSELKQGLWAEKCEGGRIVMHTDGPADTTQALIDGLQGADLFVTSGHATERDWQIGFAYRNGQFRCRNGTLYGVDRGGHELSIDARFPKVYLAVGNCLMGHVDGPDAMALAWMNNGGVAQMVGYTDLTWFGYGGWGCLDYFVEQPGRYTMAEAWLANQHALVHRLTTGEAPRADRRGLEYDRDIVALYGDPAWEARMAEGSKAFDQSLTVAEDGRTWTFAITPRRGAESFQPIDTNGSQRGGRPFVAFLPHRVKDAAIVEGQMLRPVVTDDFVLVPNPGTCEAGQVVRVVFRDRRESSQEAP